MIFFILQRKGMFFYDSIFWKFSKCVSGVISGVFNPIIVFKKKSIMCKDRILNSIDLILFDCTLVLIDGAVYPGL